MTSRASPTRRVALRLARHAARIMPLHRAEWARAVHSETLHLDRDSAALRWAAGAVVASYFERIVWMRRFALTAVIVIAGLVAIEGAQLLTQFLFQQRAIDLLTSSLPVSMLTSNGGGYAPLGIMLTIIISAPVAIVALLLGRVLFRVAPQRARAAIMAIVVADAVFLAAAMLISMMIVTSDDGAGLAPNLSVLASSSMLWAIRMMFVALPLLTMLFVHRSERSVTRGAT